MNCSTCGRDNPDHLVFCQECGQRLRPRVAPPTPAIGLPQPDVQPMPLREAGVVALAPPFPPRGEPMPPAGPPGACVMCGTQNPAHVRYCQSCGTSLHFVAPSPGPPPLPEMSSQALHPIAPTPMIEIGPSRLVKEMIRVCSRCHGSCEATAAFCKFCGASMAASSRPDAGRALAPSPNPIGVANALAPTPQPPMAAPTPAPAPIAPVQQESRRSSSVPSASAQTERDPDPPRAMPAPPLAQPTPVGLGPSAGPAVAAFHALSPGPPPYAPAAPARPPSTAHASAKIVVVTRDGQAGASYAFTDQIDIGRSEGQVIVPDDRHLSPRHARIARANGRFYLYDLHSTNGVYARLSPTLSLRGYTSTQFSLFDPGAESQGGTPGARGTEPRDENGLRGLLQGEGEGPAAYHGGAFLEDQDLILVGQQVLRFEVVKDGASGIGPAYQHDTMLFGTPTAKRHARLCQRGVEGTTLDVFHVRKVETVMGREVGDILFAEDPFLSRRHAAVRTDVRVAETAPLAQGSAAPRFSLVDLGSSNGTFLRIREAVEVFHGDQFRVGQQLFRIDLSVDAGGVRP